MGNRRQEQPSYKDPKTVTSSSCQVSSPRPVWIAQSDIGDACIGATLAPLFMGGKLAPDERAWKGNAMKHSPARISSTSSRRWPFAGGGWQGMTAVLRWEGVPALRLWVLVGMVGILAGLGAVLFRLMIRWCRDLFTLLAGRASEAGLGPGIHLLVPALGLFLVGLITTYGAREVQGHGVPQLLGSLAERAGIIRARVAFLGVLAPALTIGAGGSVGREGPIALIGGSLGSAIGQTFRLTREQTSLLLACGAGAGIAATFNAPLAGGFFALEILFGSFAASAIFPAMFCAAIAQAVFAEIMGNHLVLPTPSYPFHLSLFLPLLFLGLLAGAVAAGYSAGLDWVGRHVGQWTLPWWLRNIPGGLLLGGMGLFLPQVLGVGYSTMHHMVTGTMVLGIYLALLGGKYLATLLTIGSGGSGGVFAPSLFLGAALGGAFGSLVAPIFPHLPAGAFAVAAMGAVFSASAQAPLTAMAIMVEMTGDYAMTPGIMVTCLVAYRLYRQLLSYSMYDGALKRKGIDVWRWSESSR